MSNYRRKLMSKNGEVAMLLAREFISYDEGDRIKTIKDYAENFNTGRGTVQSAIKFLEREGAISLESRGHLGTFILSVNHKKLWDISDFKVIMGVMPLPYSKRYEGLATGLYKAFEKADIPFSLAFMRGAEKRIEALDLGKYDFAITSKLAAIHEREKFEFIDIIHNFKEYSYVGQHIIIFRDNEEKVIRDGMRVGIDPDSPDQSLLTKYECKGKNVKYIETSYSQIMDKLKNNKIDAAVWNKDEVDEKRKNLNYNIQPLTNSKSLDMNEVDTIAVMVINNENSDFKKIIDKFIAMDYIEEIQEQVLNGNIIPMY
ncbi:transporter substrate-binding domain-containing protein [Schnuerera sp. xch1]|uniref:GntR family transcriptional regulator YhfZ n=1 Tax=Schnuerera sp. xch1 TaxID=2874283 RepID=UPI001CBDF3AF|nr:GntR family transcriptional regulator YhfZ [Schnuerera sp. xch1]MBZ2175892.1 transporter substrate-binding domain-containing protein [Schnuerera sp. xch1]